MKKLKVGITVLAVALGGYLCADAWNVVPGFLTTEPPVAEALPYPSPVEHDVVAPTTAPLTDTPIDKALIKEILDEFVASDEFSGTIGLLIQDPLTGEVIYSRNADKPLIPASNEKYLTVAAALEALGPEVTFDTVVKQSGSNLYLVGGGDIMLAADAGDPRRVNGRAGLADLAQATAAELTAAGTTSVTLSVDSSLFRSSLLHPDVADTGLEQWVMDLRPIAINRSYNDDGQKLPDPDLTAARTFAKHLNENGIKVTEVARAKTPSDAGEIAKVSSAPLREVAAYLMQHSDNSLAEVFGHMVAIKTGADPTWTGAASAVYDVLNGMDLPMEGVTIRDSSGLSDQNRLTNELVVAILQRTWDCDQCPLASLPAALPVSSVEGTLADRFRGTELAGNVRAKTGSLDIVTSLSGYMTTASGRPLIFSAIISNHAVGDSWAAKPKLDVALAAIAAGN